MTSSEQQRVPVEPRDAATVLLLRPGTTAPFEVFVMVRRQSMAFAAGVVAFPGGGVSAEDSSPVAPEWVSRLGVTSPAQAAGVVGAAVRELAEETGVVVPVSGLGLWDAWTTPVDVPKRYRTWFFTAVLPEGQEALELSTESSSVAWVSPTDALDRADSREWSLMPPTYSALLRLATYTSVEDVMAATAAAGVEMFTPIVTDDGVRLPAWASELAAARPGARWT
ncbi:NUDIX hydrolase [Nocardioides sp.]|uniref:NUDIX hydrolase n=1 Tax=Nocardioides sp. TaxID=35761 RepID=UPI002606F814|nr:NUDIX hydrolase [Nocardioides sp.]